MWTDQVNFYSLPNLAYLGLGLGAAAILANTSLDQRFQDEFQDDARTAQSDKVAAVVRRLGGGWYHAPIYATAMMMDLMVPYDWDGGMMSQWGSRSLRATVVGGLPQLLLHRVLGGSRPRDRNIE